MEQLAELEEFYGQSVAHFPRAVLRHDPRKLKTFADLLGQGVPLNAVGGECVIARNSRAVRHHKGGGYFRLDVLPDALVKIAVQRFVAATEVRPVVLRSEEFDGKVEQ